MSKELTQYTFAAQEHPTYQKWNNILDKMEEMRKQYGPVSVSLNVSGDAAGAICIRFNESPWEMGYSITNTLLTDKTCANRLFSFNYVVSGVEPDHDVYGMWINAPMVSGNYDDGVAESGEYIWYCKLRLSFWPQAGYGVMVSGSDAIADFLPMDIKNLHCFPQPHMEE